MKLFMGHSFINSQFHAIQFHNLFIYIPAKKIYDTTLSHLLFQKQKPPHRLLPTNLYVVLYNFKSRHQDELDLKAGYKVRNRAKKHRIMQDKLVIFFLFI